MQNKVTMNKYVTKFTTRDSLGIESVATSISSQICPIINTVTPRPFYWAFMCWIYYDYFKNIKEKRDYRSFDLYLKKQDYFMVLSQLLNDENISIAGKEKTIKNIGSNPNGSYEFDKNYLNVRFGGMQYYNSGLFSMECIYYPVIDGKTAAFPKMTPRGEELALAFENVISGTDYFKNYKTSDKPVPKKTLIEYGKVINLSLKNFGKCKELLRDYLFKNIQNDTYDYALFLRDNKIYLDDNNFARNVLFNYYSPRGENKKYDEKLKPIINKWEIVIGRQYFVIALEMIWKFMLHSLENPKNKKEWIEYAINNSNFKDFKITDNLNEIISKCKYKFDDTEKIIKDSKKSNLACNVYEGIKLLLSIYNRFVDRNDFDDTDNVCLKAGEEISINDLINLVDKFKNKPISDFICYIMDNWLIKKHYETALVKLYNGRDGFYYKVVDGIYIKKKDFDYDFQMNRIVQLTNVMKDLDILKVGE